MDRTVPNAAAASPTELLQVLCASAIPNNIAVILHAVSILLDYGRHLIDTVRSRAAAPNFNAIAACFGTDNLATILAHLNRGILRATALRRVLLAHATTGQDIDIVQPRTRMPDQDHTATDSIPELPPAKPLATRRPTPRRARPAGWDDPELYMPTLQELERQIRRRPIGRTIQDICLDLAVVPGFCHGTFWNELFDIMTWFGGSVGRLMQQKARRRDAFVQEQDRGPDTNWDWLNMSRAALRQVLGFFIGEPPVNPLDPAAGIATAPP